MPSKLKKAIAAMKDQTSISLAKVGGAESSTLEVAILRATTHDEMPVDERYVTDVLRIVSSNRSYAGSCARAVGRRIGRTRSWVVAAKTLMLVLRIFQDGDPHFPKEVLHAMKRGYKILNLNSFRDDSSTSCPWDFTAFVRTFALYLDERLDCFLTGKLQRRTSYNQSGQSKGHSRKREPVVRDMKPSVLLDRIVHWQKLLDRAIATQPTGAARTNELVQTCMYTIVQETFDLYRDISDGLALLLDSFFHLQYNNCVTAFQTCVKASKQFEEICTFYDLCKSIGIGRTSEYPSIQGVSEELIETLQEFLKDKSSFPGANGRSAHVPPLSPNSESDSVRRSEYGGSIGTSLGDLIGGDEGYSPERFSDPGREKPPQLEDYYSANDTGSVKSEPADHRGINAVMDLLTLDDPSSPMQHQGQQSNNEGLNSSSGKGWELVLFETAENQPSGQTPTGTNHVDHHNVASNNSTGLEIDFFSDFNAPSTSSLSPLPNECSYNPFLQDTADFDVSVGAPISEGDPFGGFGHTSFAPGTDPSFSSNGFPTDFGNSMSAFESSNASTFHAEFGNINGNGIDTDGSVLPPFSTGYGNGNSNNNYQDDFFDDFSRSSNFSSNTNISVFPHGYSDHIRSISSSFLDDFSHANAKASAPRASHHARFASDDLSTSAFGGEYDNARYSVSSPTFHHARYGSNISTISSVYSDTVDSFGGYSNGVAQPTFSAEQRNASTNEMNAIVPFGQAGNDSNAFDSFGGYSNNGVAQPTFSTERRDVTANAMNAIVPFGQEGNNLDTYNSFGAYSNGVAQPTFSAEQRDVSADSMNAIVPFGQVGNNDLFSAGPRLQSTPTFRARTLDMDQHQGGSLWNENDPFESLPITMNTNVHQQQKSNGSLDQPNDLFNQQQLWLQNQNKIMSKHST